MDLDSNIFTLETSGSVTSGSCLFSILNLEKVLDKDDNQWKLVGPGQSVAENELKFQILKNGGKMFDVFDLQSDEESDYEITLVISSGDKEWDLNQARKYMIDKVQRGGLYRDIFQARYVRHCLIRGKMLNLNNYRFLQSIFYPYEAYDVLTQKVKWSSLQRKSPPDCSDDDEQEKDKEQKKQSEEKNPIPTPSSSNSNGKVVPLRRAKKRDPAADLIPRKKSRPEEGLAPPVSPISSSEEEDVQISADDEDEDEEDHVPASVKARASELKPKKNLFTKEEKQTMLNFVCEDNLHKHVKGNSIWEALHIKKLIKGHTKYSMRNHFFRYVLPKGKLEKFKISDKDLKILRRVRGD